MTPKAKTRDVPPPTSKELVEELDGLVNDLRETLDRLRELYEDPDQETPSG